MGRGGVREPGFSARRVDLEEPTVQNHMEADAVKPMRRRRNEVVVGRKPPTQWRSPRMYPTRGAL